MVQIINYSGGVIDTSLLSEDKLFINSKVNEINCQFKGKIYIKFTESFNEYNIQTTSSKLRISGNVKNNAIVRIEGNFERLKIRIQAKIIPNRNFTCENLFPGFGSDCYNILSRCKNIVHSSKDDEYPNFLIQWLSNSKNFNTFVEKTSIDELINFIERNAHIFDDPADTRFGKIHLSILEYRAKSDKILH